MASMKHSHGRRASGFSACAFALLMLAGTGFAHAQDADAGQRVHRCVGQRGEIAFSGLPCSAPQSAGITRGAPTPTAAGKIAADPVAATSCPTSRRQLLDRLDAAIARHDSNAIAALLRWEGVGATTQRMAELHRLVQRPLLSMDEDASGVRVRTGSNAHGGVLELRFGMRTAGGCHWLDW